MSTAHADLLTRTTLQVEDNPPGGSLAHMIGALQRVPGVLLAEVNSVSARAVVSHDSAVPAASLVAAAQNVGVRVRVIADSRSPLLAGNSQQQVQALRSRRLLTVAAIALVILAVVDTLVPSDAQKHWILIGLTSLLWVFFIAKSIVVRR